jgi:hypothetical protein
MVVDAKFAGQQKCATRCPHGVVIAEAGCRGAGTRHGSGEAVS